MATAKELFYNSYLKKMKRPEFQREYQPDDTYGANSVARSESVNPWAGRDQSNAKFGALGGNNNGGGDQGGMNQSEGMSFLSSVLNKGVGTPQVSMPTVSTMTSPQSPSLFSELANPVVGVGGALLGESIADMINGPTKYSDLSPSMQGYADAIAGDVVGGVAPDSGMGMGAYDKLLGKLMKSGQDELTATMSGAEGVADTTSSVPYVGAGLKTAGDLLSGKLLRRPAESIGGTAGMLGGAASGAALGSAIFPGVGTALGGALGGLFGGKGGGLLGRWFGGLFR